MFILKNLLFVFLFLTFLAVISAFYLNHGTKSEAFSNLVNTQNTLAETATDTPNENLSKQIVDVTEQTDLSPLDKKARDEAQKQYDQIVSNCDEGKKYLLRAYQSTLVELRSVSPKVEPSNPKEANKKLNNVEWNGVVKFTPEFVRPYYYPTRQWKEWDKMIFVGEIFIDGVISFHLKKLKGMPWETTSVDNPYEKIACEDLPWNKVDAFEKKDAAAKNTVEGLYRNLLPKCGGYYYFIFNTSQQKLIRLKEYSVQLFPELPTKSKESLGIEWNGNAVLIIKSPEECNLLSCKTWVEAPNNFIGLNLSNLKKQNGNWSSNGIDSTFYKKADCETVKKITEKVN